MVGALVTSCVTSPFLLREQSLQNEAEFTKLQSVTFLHYAAKKDSAGIPLGGVVTFLSGPQDINYIKLYTGDHCILY